MKTQSYIPKIVVGIGVIGVAYAVFSGGKNGNSGKQYLPEYDTAPAIDAKAIAENLYEIMKVINYSNSERDEMVYDALGTLSAAQFAQVAKAFGMRSYNSILGNQTRHFPLIDLPKRSLKFWLQKELSTSSYLTLKKRFTPYL